MGRPFKSDLAAGLAELLGRVGSNLATIRVEKGLTQAELARKSKVSPTTVNEIETRKCRDIRLSTLQVLAEALGIEVTQLLARSDLDLSSKDRIQLFQASEILTRISKKLKAD